jgi:hypothetical protein
MIPHQESYKLESFAVDLLLSSTPKQLAILFRNRLFAQTSRNSRFLLSVLKQTETTMSQITVDHIVDILVDL